MMQYYRDSRQFSIRKTAESDSYLSVMEAAALERLKLFMLSNFDFDGLKQMNFWPKGTKRTDYEAQAARIVKFFGLKSVYDYAHMPPFGTPKAECTPLDWPALEVDKLALLTEDAYLN